MTDAPSTGPFELSGGALCLDFANTREDRGRPETEKLRSYGDLLAFARQAGVLDRPGAEALARAARRDPPAAESAFEAARDLRDAIYRLFSARAAGKRCRGRDLERLNGVLAATLGRIRVERREGGGFAWAWSELMGSLAGPLGPIARSAAELLTSDGALSRVRECDGPTCTWLFLDASRNRSRRWCSMETCGNRAKARRHYRRRRAATGGPG